MFSRKIESYRVFRQSLPVSTLSGFEEAAQNAEVDTSECNSISLAIMLRFQWVKISTSYGESVWKE
jgi:hypothetical protein